MFSRDRLIIVLSALLILGIYIPALWNDAHPGYGRYQSEFHRIVLERFGTEKASLIPLGLQQIWLARSQRVDRCMSCHLGVTWEGLQNVDPPYRTHSIEPLKSHPLERFGCTYCHGGQGYATNMVDAHGWVRYWEEPLLDSKLSEEYRIRNKWGFLQTNCNVCHRFDRETAGADYVNAGKKLILQKGCRACHLINGRGGSIGPDLTRIGEKNPELYDYTRLTTRPSFYSWQLAHLQNPKSLSEGTVMPDFGFNSEEASSIGLVLMSWRDADIPAELLPGAILRDVPTAEELERERLMREGDGKFFVEKTCFICHDVSSFDITSATKIGPDLALAVEDAPRRFGRTLDDFIMNPSGTMQVVLSKQIHLTKEERSEAIELLKRAYQKYQERSAKSEPGSNSSVR